MLIQHGLALCRSENSYQFAPLELRVEGGRITACGSGLRAMPGEKCFSARGLLILPGFVNSHVHSYTNLLKGTTFGEPLELWGLGTVALGGAMSQEDMALSAHLGIAEMLRHGVTACVDHIPHSSAVYSIAESYRNAGFRAALAPMLHDRSDHFILKGVEAELPSSLLKNLRQEAGIPVSERIAQYEQWIADLHRPNTGVSMLIGVNAPQRCTRLLLQEAGELAKKHGLGVHMHLLETVWQSDSMKAEGTELIEEIAQAGLLNERTSLAHCVHLTEAEMDRIALADATVVHNPTSNLFLGSGVMPLWKYRAKGIQVALGSDGCNCATSHNLLEIARTALLLERSYLHDPALWQPLVSWYDSLTRIGWKAMGLNHSAAGMLTPSAPADIVFCSMNNTGLLPAIDLPVQFLINQCTPDVRHVMVAGKFVLKDKKILAFDESALYEAVRERTQHLKTKFQDVVYGTAHLHRAYEKAFRKRLNKKVNYKA